MTVEISEAQMLSEMTPEMKQFYMDFHGNRSRLKSEWELCNNQYNKAIALYSSKDVTKQYLRSPLRKIADYWSHRRNALEAIVKADEVKEWKEVK